MKEIVDRILNGEIEELTGEGFVFSILKDGDYIDIIPESKEVSTSYSTRQKLTPKDMRELAGQLTELAEELERRKKFRTNEELYYIRANGEICPFIFFESNSFHLSLLAIGNAFKTRKEAEAHKDEIMAKHQDLRNRGLV